MLQVKINVLNYIIDINIKRAAIHKLRIQVIKSVITIHNTHAVMLQVKINVLNDKI